MTIGWRGNNAFGARALSKKLTSHQRASADARTNVPSFTVAPGCGHKDIQQ
jgi:hypothetical protein